MGQTEGEGASLDGETRECTSFDVRNKGIHAPCEDRSNATDLDTDYDVNSNTTKVVASLLPELVSDILSRLPIEDVMRYQSVCKDWYALTKDLHFIHMHLSRSLCLPRRIIVEPRVDGPITSLYLVDRVGGMWRGRKIPIESMPGNYMFTVCSCQGLLCVASSNSEVDPLFIYNPITRECKELPRADFKPFKETDISVGFGFDSTIKKYKVVRFFKVYHDDDPYFYMRGQIITAGEGSWRELELSHAVLCSFNTIPVFLDGALHWVIDNASHPGCEQILVLDLSNEKFRTIKFPSSIIQSINYPEQVFLFNLGGSLSLVEHDIWKRFRLWRIERTNTKKGYKFYQSSYSITAAYKGLILSLKLQDRLIDNSFLFHVVVHMDMREEIEKKDHLSLYFPEKEEYKVLEVHGVPNFFHPNLFIPSLVSPTHVFGHGAQEVDAS